MTANHTLDVATLCVPSVDEIFDGYTIDGFIAAVPGVHGSLEFRYRPVDPLTERKYAVRKAAVAKLAHLDDEKKEQACELLTIDMVAKQISWWNLADGKKEPIPVSVQAILRYFPGYRYGRLLNIVSGGGPSDQRPDTPSNEATPASPETAETGNLVDAEKNSSAA